CILGLFEFCADLDLQPFAPSSLISAHVEYLDGVQTPGRDVGCGWPENFGKWHLHQNISVLVNDFERILCRVLPRAQFFETDVQDGLTSVEISRLKRRKLSSDLIYADIALRV